MDDKTVREPFRRTRRSKGDRLSWPVNIEDWQIGGRRAAHLVVDGEVQTLGLRVDVRVLLTSLTDGRGVHEGSAEQGVSVVVQRRALGASHSQPREVVLHRREEEVGVLPPDLGEVDMLEQRRGQGVEVVSKAKEVLLWSGRRVDRA
jgi:hypothetical protein